MPSDTYMHKKTNHQSSDDGLLPGWCQAIIWTNAGILLILLLGIYTSFIQENTFDNIIWKWRPFCLGLNVLIQIHFIQNNSAQKGLTRKR